LDELLLEDPELVELPELKELPELAEDPELTELTELPDRLPDEVDWAKSIEKIRLPVPFQTTVNGVPEAVLEIDSPIIVKTYLPPWPLSASHTKDSASLAIW
jgi:hypothetical protein